MLAFRALQASHVNADAIASIVQLSPSEIEDLLTLDRSTSLGSTKQQKRGVANILEVLRAAVCAAVPKTSINGTALILATTPFVFQGNITCALSVGIHFKCYSHVLLLCSGVWSSGTAQSLITSLEREVMKAEEDLEDCVRLDESDHNMVGTMAWLSLFGNSFVALILL